MTAEETTFYIVTIASAIIFAIYIYLAIEKPGFALVSCLFMVVFLEILAVGVESIFALILTALLFPTVLVIIILVPRPPDADVWYRTAAKWFLVLIFLSILFSALSVFNELLGALGFAIIAIFIWASIVYASTSRFASTSFALSTIGYCVRQNLPLTTAIDSAVTGQSDKRARILRRINKWLLQGYSLSQALRFGFPKCPAQATAAIAAAEKVHQVPQALLSIEKDMIAKADDRRKLRPVHPWYPLIVMSILFFVVMFVSKFILPRFIDIIRYTNDSPLPRATVILMDVLEFFVYDYGWVLGLLLFLIFPVGFQFWLIMKFRTRRPEKPYLFSKIMDFFKWYLPLLHWFEKNYSLVQVVETLRMSLNTGIPVDRAIANTLDLDMNHFFRKKIRNWLRLVEAGENISRSALKCGLGKSIAWAFDTDVNPGNTLSILKSLETFYRSNYSYIINLSRLIFWPCVTVMLGCIVGFVVYAFFMPMVQVINIQVSMVP